MRPFLALVSVVAIALASASAATGDPVRPFDTFEVDCGSVGIVELARHPGSSQVVTINGVVPEHPSVVILVDYELFLDGEFIEVAPGQAFQPPGIQHTQEIVECFDTRFALPDYFKLWLLITPAN
jgi:hypothetical protein